MHLPYGSRTWIAAGADASWGAEAHLIAALIDTTRDIEWGRRGAHGSPPEPIPRPSDMKQAQEKRDRTIATARRKKLRLRSSR